MNITENYEKISNQIEWAKTLTTDSLSDQDQKVILSFVLNFNIFEAQLFKNNKEYVFIHLQALCNDLNKQHWFNLEEYDRMGNYVVARYVNSDNKPKENFIRLRLNSEITKKVFNALSDFKSTDIRDDKLFYYYLEIAYSFRNNLFHGKKDNIGLNKYIDCFKEINFLINKLICDMCDNNYEGLKTKF